MKEWFLGKWGKVENRYIISAIGTIIFAILLPLVIYIFRNKKNYSTLDTLGPVGDFFGGATIAFFNIASFLMLVAAIVMQKEELSLQRKELKATRNEYEITNATMKRQQFESTFFNMISLNHAIVNALVYTDDSRVTSEGRYALNQIKEKLKSIYTNPTRKMLESDEKTRMHLTYDKFYELLEPSLGHYFRNLYRIIKWIDESELGHKDKKNYLGILRAQLSSSELVLIFYNNNTEKGKNFKKLVDKYEFFDDHLNDHLLIIPEHRNLLS